jgi:pimeloyl-ACP methyl ester carboxylesterase
LSDIQTALLQVNGIRLSYREWPGEKGPILCLPSLTGHKGTFDQLACHLSPDYHLFALDLRGRGDSDKPAEGYGFAYHARDIMAFAKVMGFETFSIIGHSFGATVGVYLASIRPLQIRSLVMIDGGADPKQEVMEAMYPTLHHLGKVYPDLDNYLKAMKKVPYYQPWNTALEKYLIDDVEQLPDGEVRSKSSPEAIERDLDVHFFYSMCVHFPTLQCPNMFIRPQNGLLGDKAHILDEREAAAFVAWIPNCWRVDLPNVNHYTMILSEEPLVFPPINAFLSTIY